jgi:hypothetical protein
MTLKAQLRRAVELGLAGDWEGAHEIVQEHEGEPVADWLHAVAHRMEGDLANARYWYDRCRRPLREGVSTEVELREIQVVLDDQACAVVR